MSQIAGTVTVPVKVPVEVTTQAVPVGLTTIAGTSVSLIAFVLAIIAVATSHGTHQDVEVIVAGAVGLATSAITLIGRYAQAHAALKIAAAVVQTVERERRLHPQGSVSA